MQNINTNPLYLFINKVICIIIIFIFIRKQFFESKIQKKNCHIELMLKYSVNNVNCPINFVENMFFRI